MAMKDVELVDASIASCRVGAVSIEIAKYVRK